MIRSDAPAAPKPILGLGRLGVEELAGIIVALATTLENLHRSGRTHGALLAEAVTVSDEGRLDLVDGPGGVAPADDVAALGAVLAALVERAKAAAAPTARRRAGLLAPTDPLVGLGRLGARCQGPVETRPTAAGVVTAATALVPGARLPRRQINDAPTPGTSVAGRLAPAVDATDVPAPSSGRRRVLMAAVVTLTAVLAGSSTFVAVRMPGNAPRPELGPSAPPPPSPDTGAFRDGVLTVDGASFALGQPGDTETTADWLCTGQPTVALLRPGTGELFIFDSWPDTGHDVTARPIGRVDHAVALRAVDADRDGCPSMEVERLDAPPLPLAIPEAKR